MPSPSPSRVGIPTGSDAPADGLFSQTRWSVIRRAQAQSETALNLLFARYRAPLLAYLRARGHGHHQAEDYLHGFFQVLLRRDFLASISDTRGRFRTFLLTALQNHIRDEVQKQNALKRGAGQSAESLDETDAEGNAAIAAVSNLPAADAEYDRAWARTILETALRRLEAETPTERHRELCRALVPSLYGDETAPRYREIAAQFGMEEGAVKTAAHRIRTRLRHLIREEITETVSSAEELDDELRHLVRLFSG